MDEVAEYRRQVEAGVEQAAREQSSFRDMLGARRPRGRRAPGVAPAPPAGDDLTAAMAVIEDPDAEEELLSAALQVVGLGIEERPDLVDRLLALVADTSRPADQRVAILNLLQQLSFRMAAFPGKRPLLLETLRGMVDDPDAGLRRRVIGMLAREKDEYVQRRLVEGLTREGEALVPPAKAIQFLGYDVHAEHFPLLRKLVQDPPNRAAKTEAIRLLASDPSAVRLLMGILKDTAEEPEVRRVAATSLQTLAPDKLAAQARRMVLDDDEDDKLRAAVLNSLTFLGDPAKRPSDARLVRQVERLRTQSPSRSLKQASEAFMARRPT